MDPNCAANEWTQKCQFSSNICPGEDNDVSPICKGHLFEDFPLTLLLERSRFESMWRKSVSYATSPPLLGHHCIVTIVTPRSCRPKK